MNFNKIQQTFDNYVHNFDLNNKEIKLKYEHTLEVSNLCLEIAKRMKLSKEDQDLAKLIGYLHDIGRFEQIKQFNTYKDTIFDHADNGIRLLFDKGLIRSFIAIDKYDDIIRKAVKNHNKYEIIDELNEREKLFANIIRDSDKIDNFRVHIKYYEDIIKDVPSKEIIDCFYEHKCVLLKDIKNKTDAILCTMAFIFDINYKESLELLRENGYFKQFINSIKVNDKNKELFKELEKIVYEKLGEQ